MGRQCRYRGLGERAACIRVEMQRADTITKYLGGKNQQTLVTVWTWGLRERNMLTQLLGF